MATFTYDAGSRLTQADDTADPHRPITLAYDNLDRLLTETTTLGTVTYAYDTAGRRTTMTVSGQAPVSYTYDANSRLRTITQAPLDPASIDYDAANRRKLLTLPNGVSTEYQYDLASRLTALIYRNALGTLGDLQYAYDAAGNRVSVGGSFARTLLPDAVASATYDQGNRQLAFGPATMTFDDNGNLLTQTDPSGTITYTWDARSRLTGLAGPPVNGSFAYDGLGRRARKTIGSVTTEFLYDGLDIVEETDGAGNASYLRTFAIDEALTRTDATDTTQYLADALGSTVALAAGGDTVTTTYTYAPFGETTHAGASSANPFRFTGRETDGTGLYYYRARYYHPGLGRFLAEDPLHLLAGPNAYAYVRNRPSRFRDALGLFEEFAFSAETPVVTPTMQLIAAAPVIAVLAAAAPGSPVVALTVSGAMAGTTGGAIVGGTGEAAATGAATGALAGGVGAYVGGSAVLTGTGQAVMGGLTNLAGQAAGNVATGQDPLDYKNYSPGAALGSGVARGIGTASGVVPAAGDAVGGGYAGAVARGIVNGALSGLGALGGAGMEWAMKLGGRKGFPFPGFL